MRITKILIVVPLVTAAFLSQTGEDKKPVTIDYIDCGDVEYTPCGTPDENEFTIVASDGNVSEINSRCHISTRIDGNIMVHEVRVGCTNLYFTNMIDI